MRPAMGGLELSTRQMWTPDTSISTETVTGPNGNAPQQRPHHTQKCALAFAFRARTGALAFTQRLWLAPPHSISQPAMRVDTRSGSRPRDSKG